MTARIRRRFVALAFLAAFVWWTDTASLNAGAVAMNQCESTCNESAACDEYCEVDIYPTTCGEYNGGVANGMCEGECGDGYCNGTNESYYTCPDDCPNECDQGIGYWTEEVSRTLVGRFAETDWWFGWLQCYEYWRVTARDVVCDLPNRDYCERKHVDLEVCEPGSTETFGSTCDDLNLDCWLGNDCHD